MTKAIPAKTGASLATPDVFIEFDFITQTFDLDVSASAKLKHLLKLRSIRRPLFCSRSAARNLEKVRMKPLREKWGVCPIKGLRSTAGSRHSMHEPLPPN